MLPDPAPAVLDDCDSGASDCHEQPQRKGLPACRSVDRQRLLNLHYGAQPGGVERPHRDIRRGGSAA
jgi:hypothetical protein